MSFSIWGRWVNKSPNDYKDDPKSSMIARASVSMEMNLVIMLCEVSRVQMTPVMVTIALHLIIYETDFCHQDGCLPDKIIPSPS